MAKRIYIEDMDWSTIQKMYDSGKSLSILRKELKMGVKTLVKAGKLGFLKVRTPSEAQQLSQTLSPRDYSHFRENRPALINYRADCAFKFNLKDYPEEFDFTLVEQYGWYQAKNRGNNLNGISRDHMVSVRYGFDNNLPAEHLAHPANCRLMKHNDNVSKNSKNHISYAELLKRIEVWDKKYGGLVKWDNHGFASHY